MTEGTSKERLTGELPNSSLCQDLLNWEELQKRLPSPGSGNNVSCYRVTSRSWSCPLQATPKINPFLAIPRMTVRLSSCPYPGSSFSESSCAVLQSTLNQQCWLPFPLVFISVTLCHLGIWLKPSEMAEM